MVVGLTGGIGSGKSTIASFFSTLGIPCYEADKEAKRLMVCNAVLKKQIIQLLGAEAYRQEELNRVYELPYTGLDDCT